MLNSQHACDIDTIIAVTHADRDYYDLIDKTIVQLRRAMGVPVTTDGPVDAMVEAEFSSLRERMASFLPEYREMYGRLLLKHMGAEQVAASASALAVDALRRYFDAVARMQSELCAELSRLRTRIGELPISE